MFIRSILISVLVGMTSLAVNQAEIGYHPNALMNKLKHRKADIAKEEMRFVVFSRSQQPGQTLQVLKYVDTLKPDFCLLTSDLAPRGQLKTKFKQVELDKQLMPFLKRYPTWPSSEDDKADESAKGSRPFSNIFGLHNGRYSFSYGNAAFIYLPWERIRDDADGMKWLKGQLINSKGMLIFVVLHRPFYTLGGKGNKDVEGIESVTTKLLREYNVKAVFAGHDDIYYRTNRHGLIHIVTGGGPRFAPLKREQDALTGDAFIGSQAHSKSKLNKFQNDQGQAKTFSESMNLVLHVKVSQTKVLIELSDAISGKILDRAKLP